MTTDEIRKVIQTAAGPANTAEWHQRTQTLLLCDIVDELRQNAANRKEALENWKAQQ